MGAGGAACGRRMAEVAASRERAVERILGGGLLGLAGGGACMLAESAVVLPGLASLGLAVGGLVLAGSGCVVITPPPGAAPPRTS